MLRPQQRVRERAVGVVDAGRGALGGGLLRRRPAVQVWVGGGLQAEVFGAEEAGVDGEGAEGRGAVGEGVGE